MRIEEIEKQIKELKEKLNQGKIWEVWEYGEPNAEGKHYGNVEAETKEEAINRSLGKSNSWGATARCINNPEEIEREIELLETQIKGSREQRIEDIKAFLIDLEPIKFCPKHMCSTTEYSVSHKKELKVRYKEEIARGINNE